jgi:hypothetical protein
MTAFDLVLLGMTLIGCAVLIVQFVTTDWSEK